MKNLLQELRHEDRDLRLDIRDKKGEKQQASWQQLVGKKGRLMYKGVSANSL